MNTQFEFSALCRLVALKSERRFLNLINEQGITLNPEQVITLSAVAKEVELRQGELMGMAYLASEKSKVSRIVQSLVLDGYLYRRDDISDRRSKILTLTDKGQAVAEILAVAEKNNNTLIESLIADEEIQAIKAALQKIADTM